MSDQLKMGSKNNGKMSFGMRIREKLEIRQ